MSIKPQKKVYESLDIISEEMARQMVHENKHKLTNSDGSEFFEMNFKNEEEKENLENDYIRKSKKKWTITKNNLFNRLKEKSSRMNLDSIKVDAIREENEENDEKINNPLYNIQISSIKSKHDRKNEKFSSLKINNNNNSLMNKNIEEEKNNKTKEKNILILQSDKTSNSNSLVSLEQENEIKNNTNNIKKNNDEEQKENSLIDDKNKEKINNIVSKGINKNIIKNPPRRRSLEPKLKFPLRKTKTELVDLESENSANISNLSDSEKDDENSSKKLYPKKVSMKDSLTTSEKNNKRKVRFNTNYPKTSKNLQLDSNYYISSFSSIDEKDFSEEEKPKTTTKLQKISLKNMIVYRPKFSAKYFYEHEMFLKKRKERINNSKKIKKQEKEQENNQLVPTINAYSNKLIEQNNSYIPIIKRTIEYRNQRIFRNMINERLNEKEIKKGSKTLNLNKSEADLIYWRQQFWKKKIEEKLNKSSYKKQKMENEQKENNYKNYKLQLCSYSKKIVENKTKYFKTINNNISVFERLYQDSISHEKKMKNLSNSYFNTLFKPVINHSYSLPRRNIYNKKSIQHYDTTNLNEKKKKKTNIVTKNKKKRITFVFEDINIQKSKSRNVNSKNENLSSIDSTKTSKNTNNTLKQRLSFESENIKSIKSKINTKSKETAPKSVKLGEIKEADSVSSEASTKQKKIQLNKTIKKNSYRNSINITERNFNINQLINKNFRKIKTENNIKDIKDISLSSEKNEGITSNNANNSNNSPNQLKNSFSIKQNSFKNINKDEINNSKEMKQNESIEQKQKEMHNYDSPSFNRLTRKDKNQNFDLNDSKYVNNNENFFEESHSFGNYNSSNFISKENNSKEIKENNTNRRQKSSNLKNNKNEIAKENNNKEILPKKNFKKQITNINLNLYENEKNIEKSKDTVTSEESSSSIKKEVDDDDDNLLQKIRNIEMKEERKKIDRIIEGNKYKNKIEEEKNDIELYMLNWRNKMANSIQEPFCYTDTKGIFFDFFKKK